MDSWAPPVLPPLPFLSPPARVTYERAWREEFKRNPPAWNMYINHDYAMYGLLEVLENEMQHTFSHLIQHNNVRCWHHLEGLTQFMVDSASWTGTFFVCSCIQFRWNPRRTA